MTVKERPATERSFDKNDTKLVHTERKSPYSKPELSPVKTNNSINYNRLANQTELKADNPNPNNIQSKPQLNASNRNRLI